MDLREQPQSEEITEQGITLKEKVEDSPAMDVETAANETDDAELTDGATPAAYKDLTKEQLVETLEAYSQKPGSEIQREEVAHLKQAFYTIRKGELAAEKQAFLDRGNEESAFAPLPDELEDRFNTALTLIKEKKAEFQASQEAERQANLEKKLAIIAELSTLAEDTDNVNRQFPRFRELVQEFKNVGDVSPTEATDLFRNYTTAVERFYDQLKINKDLRDYDFKKNLEQKELLIEEAEKLTTENDVITAFRRLQELHDKWRETGPVAKEIREEIWNRFKDASATINKRYQGFFEERKSRERENEEKKTAICERIEAFNFDDLKSYSAWDEMTKKILEAQEDWKKLGFASKKVNNSLFARFRETCDKFFAMKAEYFKGMRESHANNLEKKIALCERAEALKDSTDWKKTADEIIELQKEWKTVGTVDKKHSDAVWKRFQEACDYFFDRRKKISSDTRKSEQANLKQKQEIVASLKNVAADTSREDVLALIKEANAKWQQVGHVPFKDKDKVYEAFRGAINELYDKFDIKESKLHMSNFVNTINEIANDENKLYRERERLVRAYEQKSGELKTYENNLGYFNVQSKSGSSLLREMERKISHLKDDIAALEEKIKLIDSKL